ncbi:hypothetical protein HPP92_013612 [Vanilla planifolia]|uniref:Copia protein n=1 Tax=Vanilla planifolia TaxID=51239 RepID=A0A835UYT8_VANPL|nr:hypothetical protein HPP92_013612 [Vanilla planifolia]
MSLFFYLVKQSILQLNQLVKIIWLQNLVQELYHQQEESMIIFIDNISIIKLAKNSIQHERSKHIETKYHFFVIMSIRKTISLLHYSTKKQVVDIFIKLLRVKIFEELRN